MKKLLLFSIFFFIISVYPVMASTITVCSGGCNYTSIQAAIDNASSGDLINVSADTYTGDLTIPAGKENLTIMSVNKVTTIIKGVSNVNATLFPTASPNIEILSNGTKIHGFTIEGPDYTKGYYSSGVVIGASNVEIYDNNFKTPSGNDTNYGEEVSQAIQTYHVNAVPGVDISGLNIHDNSFTSLVAGSWGYEGIYVNLDAGTGSITINNNQFSGDLLRAVTSERSNTQITNNSVITNLVPVAANFSTAGAYLGIYVGGAGGTQTNVAVIGNTVKGSTTGKGFLQGIRIGSSSQTDLNSVSVTNNTVEGNTNGIYIRNNADGVVVNSNVISSNTIGLQNDDTLNNLDATYNYWGHATGPGGAGFGLGDNVSSNVTYYPWYTSSALTTLTDTTVTPSLTIETKTISDLGQDAYPIQINATLSNPSSSAPIYDAYIIIDLFTSGFANTTTPAQFCGTILASDSCTQTFNITVSGGLSPNDYYIFWTTNWTNNNGSSATLSPFEYSTITIASNPVISVQSNASFSISHGTNDTEQIQINATGNDDLTNVGITYTTDSLPSEWVVTIDSDLTNIGAGLNGLFNVTIAVPEFYYPGTYNGSLEISADNTASKYVELVVEVLENNSWTITPQNIDVYVKSGTIGLVGTYTVNNTGNIDQEYTISYSGDFFNYILDDALKLTSLNVSKNNVGTFSIYIDITGTSSNYTLNIDVEGNNSVHAYPNMTLYVNVDDEPLIYDYLPTNITPTVAENLSLFFFVNATDPDNGSLNYTWKIDGVVNQTNGNNFTYNTGFDDAGTHTVSVDLRDENYNTITQSWTVSVTNTDRAPVLSPINDSSLLENETISFNITATDPDLINGDSLSYSSNLSVISVTKINNTLATVTWINPTDTYVGNNSVEFTVSDGTLNDSQVITISVTGINDAPVLSSVGNKLAYENQELLFNVTASDVDVGDVLTFAVNDTRFNLTQTNSTYNNAIATISWTPNSSNVGDTIYLNISVSDIAGVIDSEVINIIVSDAPDAPVLDPISIINATEDQPLSFNITASDVDVGDVLKFARNDSRFALNPYNNSIAIISWTPTNDDVGTIQINFTVTDSYGLSDSKIAVINVLNVNDAPVITAYYPEYDPAIKEGTGSMTFNISVTDQDTIHGDTITYEWYLNGTPEPASNNPQYTFTAIPAGNYIVNVTAIDSEDVEVSHTWNLLVTNITQINDFQFIGSKTTDLSNVTITDVANFTIEKQNEGYIKFTDNLNLINAIDFDNCVYIQDNIVGMDTVCLGIVGDKAATITLRGASYDTIPVILKSSAFTKNSNDITVDCTPPLCNIISYTDYPTTSGIIVFNVTQFSSYKVGGSGLAPVPGTGILEITEVDISEDNPKPDEIVEIVIEIENEGELDVEDIELIIELRDEDGDVVKDEENDELEDDEDFDLDEGDDEEFTFTFKMPADAKDGDEYTVYVEACGEDEDGVTECAIDDSETIKIEREKHEVEISSAVISPSEIRCYDSFEVVIGLKNIGKKDEDVQLTISSAELEISESQTFELEAYDDDDYKKTISKAFAAPSDLAVGVYTINIRAEYSDEEETETLQLTKTKCQKAAVVEEAEETITVVDTSTIPSLEEEKVRFTDSLTYVILLIILTILILGLVIFSLVIIKK